LIARFVPEQAQTPGQRPKFIACPRNCRNTKPNSR
jgi:hypothetical protein